jgi:hypothetical protein
MKYRCEGCGETYEFNQEEYEEALQFDMWDVVQCGPIVRDYRVDPKHQALKSGAMIAVNVRKAHGFQDCHYLNQRIYYDPTTGDYGNWQWSHTACLAGKCIKVHPDGTADIELAPGVTSIPGCNNYVGYATYYCMTGSAVGPYRHSKWAIWYSWEDIKLSVPRKSVVIAARDSSGSLLCTRCNEPYPYAEPNADGGFVCYGCRATL